MPDDLMTALGKPPKPAAEAGGGGYLSGKPAQLRGYLEDATDASLSPEQRAEALCRAIEFKGEEAEVEKEPMMPLEGDDGY